MYRNRGKQLIQILGNLPRAHYIAQANREKLGFSGMDKVVAFDHSESAADFAANEAGTSAVNGVVTFPGNIRKKG